MNIIWYRNFIRKSIQPLFYSNSSTPCCRSPVPDVQIQETEPKPVVIRSSKLINTATKSSVPIPDPTPKTVVIRSGKLINTAAQARQQSGSNQNVSRYELSRRSPTPSVDAHYGGNYSAFLIH